MLDDGPISGINEDVMFDDGSVGEKNRVSCLMTGLSVE